MSAYRQRAGKSSHTPASHGRIRWLAATCTSNSLAQFDIPFSQSKIWLFPGLLNVRLNRNVKPFPQTDDRAHDLPRRSPLRQATTKTLVDLQLLKWECLKVRRRPHTEIIKGDLHAERHWLRVSPDALAYRQSAPFGRDFLYPANQTAADRLGNSVGAFDAPSS